MPEKTLKIKRVFVYMIYNSLRRMPPKDYPSTEEIKSTIMDILPALKGHVTEYIDMLTQAEELGTKVVAKELSEEEAKVGVDAINENFRSYSKDHGDEVVDIALDKGAFTTLLAQFNREGWGKMWVVNIEEFGELLEAFAEAGK